EKMPGLLICPDQRPHFRAKRRVGSTNRIHIRFALFCRQLKRRRHYRLDLPPTRLNSHTSLAFRRCASQARATFHSRFTVAVEMPSTSEASSTESPPKNRSSTTRA